MDAEADGNCPYTAHGLVCYFYHWYSCADHAAVVNWFSSPVISIFMILFVSTMVYHSTLGVQVVIEDYIHKERWKFGLLIGLKFLGITLGVVAVFSILKLAL